MIIEEALLCREEEKVRGYFIKPSLPGGWHAPVTDITIASHLALGQNNLLNKETPGLAGAFVIQELCSLVHLKAVYQCV